MWIATADGGGSGCDAGISVTNTGGAPLLGCGGFAAGRRLTGGGSSIGGVGVAAAGGGGV
jgi:hypothetical protein